MKGYLKYLTLLTSLSLVFACKKNGKQTKEKESSLYDQPLTVPLNLKEGYAINLLTGDSTKQLINSIGDTILTGVPFLIKGSVEVAGSGNKPVVIKPRVFSKTVIESNSTAVQNEPRIFKAANTEISQVSLSSQQPISPIQNTSGIVITGQSFPAIGKKVALREPKPVKVQPLRFKDNAVLDIQYFDISQGLSFSYVTALLQDKNGYLWFGTDGYGVCKYDGTYLTTYTQKEGLINNHVTCINEDKQGKIWIGTQEGISVFDGNSFLQFTEKNGLPGNATGFIQKDREGNLWFSSVLSGITRYDGNNFITYSTKEGLQSNKISSFFEDSKGIKWFGCATGISLFDGNRFSSFNSQLEILNQAYSIMEDKKGNIWFGSTLYGLIKYDGKAFAQYTMANGMPDNSIMSMMTDRNDNIWISTRYSGITKFDGSKFTVYGLEQGLSENKVWCAIEDRQGNIWVGTIGGGINKINDRGFSEKIKPENIGNSRARPIINDAAGQLWLGTEAAGLYAYDGTQLINYVDKDQFELKGFRSALVDKENNLWFGETDGNGLYKYDHKQFLYYLPPRRSSNFSLFEDKKGTLWIGTADEGAAAFNGTDYTYYNITAGFSSNKILAITADKKNNCWFGTEGGAVVKYDGKMFTVFSERQGFFSNRVSSIIEDRDGNLWFGTLGAGVCKFDGNSFTYYTEKQGLALDLVWSLKEDSAGQIWVGTDRGLSLLIPENDKQQAPKKNYAIYSFGLEDGLKTTDFNLNGVCIDNSNRIWWGTGKALITRDLTKPFIPFTPQSVDLSYIEINEHFFDFRSLTDSTKKKISFSGPDPFHNYPDHLSLAHDQNRISFHFAAIDWSAPHKIKYSYRLIGAEYGWSHPSPEPSANYRNLSHGDYEFQVKAIGQSGEWTAPFTYRFTIRPAWWQTWWFNSIVISFAAFILLFIARLIYLYRLRKQRVLLEKQLAIQYERQRISAEMHDDIGAGLSGIRLLTEMTKNKIKDEQAAEEVEKIYRSVGDVSSKMKEVIWSLNTENDDLPNLIAYIQKQARALLEHYPCQLIIDVPDNIRDKKISGEARRNIFLVTKEALHNIIKHSAASKVNIIIKTDDKLRIQVSDNGKGFTKDQQDGQGNGMKNMRQRVQQLNGTLSIKNEDGLTLIFEIPI